MSETEKPDPPDEIPAMVVSHERSGTHFLMNALATEFGYVSEPPLAFDPPVVNINFFHPRSVAQFFVQHRATKREHIRKSHHQFSFFQPVVDTVLANTHLFYIYRDPRDMLHSFRHFLNSWGWFEGPKVADAGAFIRTPPAGQMLRYQFHQLPDMLDRWRIHVEGWVDAAEMHDAITLVRYEDLQDDFGGVMDQIAKRKNWARRGGAKPEIDQKTVLQSKRGHPSNRYAPQDLEFFEQRAGPAMRRLGYEI